MPERASHSWIELDRAALLANVRRLSAVASPAALLAVVKGNAYGHGLTTMARVLEREKIWGFGVAGIEEALALRAVGIRKPILSLSYLLPACSLTDAIQQGVSLVAYDDRSLSAIRRAARTVHRKPRVHLKIDTGTARIGFPVRGAGRILARVARDRSFVLEGIFSHFADAENDLSRTLQQLQRFQRVVTVLDTGRHAPLQHIACSAALLRLPSSRLMLARAGIALYGIWPSRATEHAAGASIPLRPVLTWKTTVLQVKVVPPRTSIGYARAYTTKRRAAIAVLPVGYADGYDRSLSNRGAVLIRGKRAPIRGNVCMNLTMVDVSAIPDVRADDEAVLIGRQGRGVIAADELAGWSGTIAYETLTRLSVGLPRLIV